MPKTSFGESLRQGVIAESVRPQILQAVRACPTITGKTLKFVLGCLED